MRSKTNVKKCGTCDFWIGEREFVYDSKSVLKIDIFNERGLCNNVHSNFTDKVRSQGAKCIKYSKWTEII